VAGPVRDRLEAVPQALPLPGLADVLVLVGVPAAVLLLVVLLLRRLPAISTWEAREAALLRRERPFVRTRVAVIGKPS
jgi:hypothetical protein